MDSLSFSPDYLETLFEYDKYFRIFTLALQRKNEALYNSIIYKDPTMAHRTFGIDDETLLHTVGRFGTPDTAELLIKLGSDVNARDNNGHTPLYHAAKRSTEIVEILVSNGADISIPSNESITPLQQVLLLGSVERLEILLNKPQTQTHKPSTDVQRCREVLELLFNQRERTDLQLTKEDFPLLIFFAARYGDEETFKLVLQESEQLLTNEDMEDIKNNEEYLDIYEIHPLPARDPIELNIQGYFGRTALHYAVREQLPDVVRFLLNQGADVNATTHYYYTPLHYAACLQNEEIIQILLNAGADLNLKSRIGATPLHLVSDYSSFKTLIRPGHGVNYHEYPIELVYHHYRESDVAFNPRVITLLLKSGANIEARGEHGTTVFHEACREGRLDMVIFFLKCGADPYARDEENRTSLHHAAVGNNLDIVELLLRIGLEVDAVNNFGCTPLIYLAQDKRQERLEMIEFLVDKGANINARNKNHDTALHVATNLERLNIIELLLELKADIGARNKENFSPLVKYFMATNNTLRPSPSLKILVAFMTLVEDDVVNHHKTDPIAPGWTRVISLFEECKLELETMKKKRVCADRRVSFYDFLCLSCFKAVIFAGNEEVMQVLESGEYKNEFPLYAFLLERRIERVKVRRLSMKRMFSFFIEYGDVKLPALVIEKVLSYMCDRDFKNFEWALSGRREGL